MTMDFTALSKNRLDRSFYANPTLQVARGLLGKFLVVNCPDRGLQVGQIIETESYIGENDEACHAHKGRTPRTELMYKAPGHLYVYLIYCMYYFINIITEDTGFPAAVLIRTLKPIHNIEGMVDGPGKLTKTLGITKADFGLDVTTSNRIFIADSKLVPQKIITLPRVGIDYAAEPWKSVLWRFLLEK